MTDQEFQVIDDHHEKEKVNKRMILLKRFITVIQLSKIMWKKKDLLLEGQNCGDWSTVQLASHQGEIEQGYVFKDYLDKGLAMDPAEYSLLHMRGRFAFSVASLSWLEKSVASTLFVAPPKATFQEALADFLEVERIRPNKWIDNLLYLAKAYIAVSDKTNAAKYLKQASELEPADDSDKEALAEVKTLMKKYK
uniref:Regulator of microtubule dynamics protein 1 n=1 Tax=Ditylenchus dipsaci TaxID=166011 RepID=A0A915E3W8_9BILA